MTVETILNLIWLGITLAALGLWRFRWKRAHRGPGHNVRLETVAMICILALLFPVISLTDDLHPEVIPVDATSSKRALCLLAAQNGHGSHAGDVSHQHFDFDCPHAGLADAQAQFVGQVSDPRPIEPVFRHVTTSDRAPPAL